MARLGVHYRSARDGVNLTRFRKPPRINNPAGKERRVGVEMEMAGVDVASIAGAVTDCFGGSIERESAFVSHVRDTEFGEFRVELDANLLKSRGYLDHLARVGIEVDAGEVRDNLEDLLSRVAGTLVPHELVCPPVPLSQLAEVDRVRAALQARGARGTESSLLYAFGLQLNVEIAESDAAALLAVLRAFLVRYPVLVERSGVDLARKLSPYIQPYPEDYLARILEPDYAPDLRGLIDDFLAYTPTRNRPLDLLPLFAWLDEGRVMAAPVERELIKPRPTWHYRLPNCLIDDPTWSLADPWNGWVEVEELAEDPSRLNAEMRRRLAGSGRLRRWLAGVRRTVQHWFAKS